APAQPQAPVIIIVDFQAVLRDAAASRAVEEQIDGMRADLQNEFSEIEQELRSVELELTEGRSEMSEEEFLQRRREFERRVSDAQERAQASRAALDAAFDTAMGSVRAALLQVIATLAEQAGATIVLNKNQ